MSQSPPEPLSPSSLRQMLPPTRHIIAATLRAIVGIALLLIVYAVVPLKPESERFGAFIAVFLGLAVFIALFVRELGKVYRSESPALRGLESLAFIATLFVVVFSVGYVVMSESYPPSFSQPLSKIDAMYFTVTVLSTVGFGDIHAVAGGAKVLVTIQMVLDLVLIGFALRILTTTAKVAQSQRRQGQGPPAPQVPPAPEGR